MLGALNVEQDVAELKKGGLVERLGEDVCHLRLRRDVGRGRACRCCGGTANDRTKYITHAS